MALVMDFNCYQITNKTYLQLKTVLHLLFVMLQKVKGSPDT